MDIILLERVEKLGQMGQVVKVRPGYARNFLLPQKKALRATKANLAFFETQKAQLQAQNLERRKEAEEVAGKMKGLAVVITRQAAESGMLYGSVNGRDIAEAVTANGFTVERNQVAISDPIKSLGLFDVRVILHPEVSVNVKVNVARSLEEAEMQAQRGGMVTTADLLADEEEAEAAAAAAADEEEDTDNA
ncbi:50S ribosomal protein L9 [Skermanella mucosa]|uniref:50S ribosomal protein L9 n=1 Tax=Skermanella mucosa TaxID=1789672 RepID=UPI00192C4E27|nr:50S ribosomal protein L9 [Skermanella mucosa]UEM22583.1 50S ribosomal protein L9 [Skermanella mucosa]